MTMLDARSDYRIHITIIETMCETVLEAMLETMFGTMIETFNYNYDNIIENLLCIYIIRIMCSKIFFIYKYSCIPYTGKGKVNHNDYHLFTSNHH